MLEFDLAYELSLSNLLFTLETGRKAETSFGFKPQRSLCNRKNNKPQTQHLSRWVFFQEMCVEPKCEFTAEN